MSNEVFERCVELPVPVETAFAYHERPGALGRLIPPWQEVSVERSDHSLLPDSKVVLKTSFGPMPLRWHAKHVVYDPPAIFADVQESGPFAYWRHEHRFSSVGESSQSRLCDHVEYRVPGGAVGRLLGGKLAGSQLDAMFAYRHRTTRDDLQLFADHDPSPMRIAVSGASGLVGSSLTNVLNLLGHRVDRLKRGEPTSENASSEDAQSAEGIAAPLYPWKASSNCQEMEGLDAVVHLAGKSIADKRWNDRVKQEILDSRVDMTRKLCQRLASLTARPRVLICASAIGVYGDRGDEVLTEESESGSSFLPEVARQWEAACQPAIQAGIRVVNVRIGIVVSPQGGALSKLLLPAKLGVNGPVSDGKQWWSWIALDDLIGIIYHAIKTDAISGPINAVTPQAVTSKQFAKDLGHVLRRPAFLPAPAPALRLALGEMADALLLASTRVEPAKLRASGYRYRFETLTDCLSHLLGKAKSP
ncbi:MAG: TIGR01777 family oxidoreductase [Pirellulaceae bacterium]